MVALPTRQNNSKTVQAILNAYVKKNDSWLSRRMGASTIGHECMRYLWYNFRQCGHETFRPSKDFDHHGQMLRLLETGHSQEDRMANDLRLIEDLEFYTLDPKTEKQWTFTACQGHFVIKLDGVLLGVPEAPKSWHTWEAKSMKRKDFLGLVNHGIEKKKPEHFIQCQLGMHLSQGIKRCLYMVVMKDTDKLYTERLRYDKGFGQAIIAKAERVIFSPQPLHQHPECSKDFWRCKWCDYFKLCHEDKLPLSGCRTCVHSSPANGARWTCALNAQVRAMAIGGSVDDYQNEIDDIDNDKQLGGCGHHLFIPQLVPGAVVQVEPLAIKYQLNSGVTWWDGKR